MIGLDVGSLILLRYLEIYRACVAVLKKPMYSTFTVDNTTVSYLLLSHNTGSPVTIKIFPSVEQHVSLHSCKIRVNISSRT